MSTDLTHKEAMKMNVTKEDIAKLYSHLFCTCSKNEREPHPEYKNICIACGKPISDKIKRGN